MNSRQRILNILEHKEADKVPYDLAGAHVTGIHVKAYKNLCGYPGINPEPVIFTDQWCFIQYFPKKGKHYLPLSKSFVEGMTENPRYGKLPLRFTG